MQSSFEISQLDPEFVPFWESVQRSRLSFPHCNECDQFHWYPMTLCPHCRSAAIDWKEVPAKGELYSYTQVRHPYSEKLARKVPYFVALVTFEAAPGVRLVTNLVDVREDELAIGLPVSAVFRETEGGRIGIGFCPG